MGSEGLLLLIRDLFTSAVAMPFPPFAVVVLGF